ncbi:MAG: rhomboid family intramembrane serine protease [Propylenella sp.]
MFPISDDNPRRHLTPYVNFTIIGACVLVFLWQATLGEQGSELAFYRLGMIPARLLEGKELQPDFALVPAWATVFTSMFLHGGWLHLGGNMLYLWIFGDNIEDSMGHGRYLTFYLLSGVAAALAQGWTDPSSTIPMVGASGAISGVLGAYIVLHPGATVRVLIFLGFFVTVTHIPAVIVLGVWFGLQLLSGLAPSTGEAGVAFWAHIGGFVAGIALVPFFKRRAVPMLERPRHRAFQMERRRGPWG